MLDFVDKMTNFVDRRIGAERDRRSGQIIADCARDNHHGNSQSGVLGTMSGKYQTRMIRLKNTYSKKD